MGDGAHIDENTPTHLPPIGILADITPSFTYASFQNAIPVIRSISIENPTALDFEGLTVELTSNPSFLRPKVWNIDRIIAGEKLVLSDRKVELDATYLSGLNEAERGVITLVLYRNGEVLSEQRLHVRLLARDEWGGVADMAQLLPAFAMPNDPAVSKVLKLAADKLAAYGAPSGLDGYQSQDPKRAFLLTASIYTAIAGMSLHYAEPPASFEARGQKIRRPATIATDGLATCLDTTLLFAAALEAAGLNPVILMFEGHAAVGVWLTKRTLPNAIETDAMEIRKAMASKELIIFETTGVTHKPPMTLEQAQRVLEVRLDETQASRFVAAIDIHRSRSGGITPLASHEPLRHDTPTDLANDSTLELSGIPGAESLPSEWVEVKPTSPAGRIDRWQKKLLDLTLRNRLLNFPDSKKTIPFLCTDISYLEDRLAGGSAIHLISLPEQNPLGERDANLYREVRGRDLNRGFAAEALLRDELSSTLDGKNLEARLIDLYRQVRNDMAEGGTNTLFLAVGFLRWKKKPEDERSYRAPLLLVPVKLERKSASSRFTLRFHEDEPRFNATLLQFLERDFDLKLSQFDGDLPLDESGIDVPRVLGLMRQAIRDVPGMEVLDETALSTFSFAKFLMWKDLVERTDALRQNRVVRHLIDTPEQAFDTQGAFKEDRDLDSHYAPADIISLLPADSSQISASIAAAEGRDFVIVGPPGTGKSQTIANMIANCLAAGKTVLFVAEKTAALDVVYRRLRAHGLGDHCLELHSNKADRKSFLAQLRKSWESGTSDASGWVEINEKLRLRRDQLNAYVAALHRPYGNGLTPYAALGIAMKHKDQHAPAFSWDRQDAHDQATRRTLEELAGELGRVFQAMEKKPVLRSVNCIEWSSAWQENLITAASKLNAAAQAVRKPLEAFLVTIGLPAKSDAPFAELELFSTFASAMQDSAGTDYSIMFDREFAQLRPALEQLEKSISDYHTAETNLSASYAPDEVLRIPVDDLDRQWKEATASIWPMNLMGQGRVQKILKAYAATGTPAPDKDLPLLRRMQTLHSQTSQNALASKPIGFAGLESDLVAIDRRLAGASRLRESVRRLNRNPEEAKSLIAAITPALSNVNDHDPIHEAATGYMWAFSAFKDALEHFRSAAGQTQIATDDGGNLLADTVHLTDEITAARHLLRDWSSWCFVREKGQVQGLTALIDDLETGAIQPEETEAAFKLAYARWWLPLTLDTDPVLRDFRRFQHEHAIEEFRQIDDLVRAEATSRVISVLSHGLPAVQSVPRNSELGLLRHQMELQRPNRSIREMIGAMPASFSKLAPCMLMSPLSIAQYMPTEQALFDIVIFDEASQITTWDAVGAIARARQTIIVGDPKQLPPTNFFGRNEDDGDGADIADHERDLESILDEARASGIPVRDLRWHYRSRNESLIAFSNYHYYQNRLITFPSPSVEDRAVRLRAVKDGVYDKGKSRTNPIEARSVTDEAVSRLRKWLKLPESSRPTLGIITFNALQQALIQDLLDDARRKEPDLEWFFAEDRIEPVIVKNLENVQGDERDVILFSITFWKDASGKPPSMDFGALNKDGGERRLNVAVTRARQELIVFSGFTADQIDSSRTKALGVHHLKAFLDFAERGPIALPAQDAGSLGGAESPFEDAVTAELERLGWQIVPQVGVSGFRIDIGVRHPDLPGAYLAGVECDGATYHRAATARDRDKVREQVLRGLGWNIVRVWSTDWWFDAQNAIQRLHDSLTSLLDDSRRKAAETTVPDDEAQPEDITRWDMGNDIEPSDHAAEESQIAEPEPAPPPAPKPNSEELVSITQLETPTIAAESLAGPTYRLTDLSLFSPEPDRFYEFSYRATLKAMVNAVIDCEAPLREDILAQRIARAHGWLRTGNKIRERIDLHLQAVERTSESSGDFIWKQGALSDVIDYRPPFNAESRRGIADIPIAELAAIIVANRDILSEPDVPLELARFLGVERLAATSRTRLSEAIDRAKTLLT
jgi:very-short-patch-repair endonuclease